MAPTDLKTKAELTEENRKTKAASVRAKRKQAIADKQEADEKAEPKAPQDYTISRKKIIKGKMAPQGSSYVHIALKTSKAKYTNAILIQGAISDEQLQEIGDHLRLQLKAKYSV